MVPDSARADQLLQEFLERREHLFIAIDEYGVFSGIVTLEDVIEEIVGEEIVGEFDPAVDTYFDQYGVKLVTKKKFALHLDGTTIDFKDGPMGRGFAIDNPNYVRGCPGCGH